MQRFAKIIIFAFILTLVSCAKTDEEQVRSAIDEANYYLSSMDCTSAKNVLDDVGFQSDNARYISTYASVYGCKAGFKELVFFTENISKVNSASLMTSLAQFDTSNETVNDSADVQNIHDAIFTLLGNDGTAQPDTNARNAKFGTKRSGDLSMQALYLIFVAMGKHFALYGNADLDPASATFGQKGKGVLSNSCIFSYTTQDAVDWINSIKPGSCTTATGNEGSDLLEAPETDAEIKTRLCRGIVYYNNMMDILSNITLPGSGELGDVGNVQTALALLMNTAESAEIAPPGTYNDGDPNGKDAISTLKTVTGQAQCEAETIERIEKWYAIFFETIYQ